MCAAPYIIESIREDLRSRLESGAYRKLLQAKGGVDFFSNDYLGFARESQDVRAAHGATGSRLISGNKPEHEALEETAAKFHRAEAALLFNSGYDANLGLISALAKRELTLIIDERSHASIHDAGRLGFSKVWKFAHNDTAELSEKLTRAGGGAIVVVESIYSMEGDEAPLREICEICEKSGAALIVDEAHAGGVYGPDGAGIVCRDQLESQVFARIITFGKAFGRHGAVVVGSKELREYLINFSRPFIYSTSLAPSSVASVHDVYERLLSSASTREALFSRIEHFKFEAARARLPQVIPSSSAIQAISVAGNANARRVAETLRERGLLVKEVLSPTVARGTERIRVVIHSFNKTEEITRVVDELASALTKGELK